MTILDAVQRWYDANGSGQVEPVMDTLTADGTFTDPMTRGHALSGEGLRALLTATITMFPDLRYEVVSAGSTSDVEAAAQWVMTGTHHESGRRITLAGADFFTFDSSSDRFSSVVGYFDSAQLRKQLQP